MNRARACASTLLIIICPATVERSRHGTDALGPILGVNDKDRRS